METRGSFDRLHNNTPGFILEGFDGLSIPYKDDESEQTRKTVYQHFHDLAKLDVGELIRLYAPGCRISIGTESYEGIDAVRAYYKETLGQLADQHTTLRLFHLKIRGKTAFLTWEQHSESLWVAFGATTFIVIDGLIVWQQLVARERKPGAALFE